EDGEGVDFRGEGGGIAEGAPLAGEWVERGEVLRGDILHVGEVAAGDEGLLAAGADGGEGEDGAVGAVEGLVVLGGAGAPVVALGVGEGREGEKSDEEGAVHGGLLKLTEALGRVGARTRFGTW